MAIVKVRWDFTSRTEEQASHYNIKIYPNPVRQGFFHLDIGSMYHLGENLSLKLKDVNGRFFYEQNYIGDSAVIHIPDFPNGLYFVELVGPKSRFVGKIVIQNE
jgi:hypothetical protein